MTSPIQSLTRPKLSLFKTADPKTPQTQGLTDALPTPQAESDTPTAPQPRASVTQQAETRKGHTQDAASLYRQMGLSALLDPKSKTLTLTGSQNDDQISVTAKGRRSFQVSMNGVTQEFKDVEALRIDGMGGGDFVNVDNSVTIPTKINGGAGEDILYGGGGGGGGDNEIHGDGDADIIRGGPKQNKLFGEDGVDHIETQGTNNAVNGGKGRDIINNQVESLLRIDGTDSDDNIHVYPAGDRAVRVNINGEDTIHEDVERIEIYAGAGDDTVLFDPGVNIPTKIRGAKGNDILKGGDAFNAIYGGVGDDILYGGAKKDQLSGGNGADLIFGRGGADTIFGGKGNDVIDGGRGNDRIFSGSDDDVVNGNEGDDHIQLGSGNDKGFGGADNDKIDGGSGINQIDGGTGKNKIRSTSKDLVTSGKGDSVFAKAAMRSIVKSRFDKWDTSANGKLSEAELDTAMSSSNVNGDQAAALASIKSQVFGGKELPTSVSQSSLEYLGKEGFFDGTLTRAKDKIWNSKNELFSKDGPQLSDIQQGSIGDCAWLSALSSKVHTDPDSIRDMIKDRGDGTFDVKFAGHDTVNVQAPTDAQKGYGVESGKGQWVSVLERGYNKVRAEELGRPADGQIRGKDGVTLAHAIQTQTGHSATSKDFSDLQQTRSLLTDAFANDRIVLAAGGKDEYPGIQSRHAYTVVGFDPATDTVTLRNPWGSGEPTVNADGRDDGVFKLTMQELTKAFGYATYEDPE